MNPNISRTYRVRHYECDLYGHVNNSIYLRYLQETALTAAGEAGYDLERLSAMGVEWWPEWVDIEYLIPLKYGDAVEVAARPSGSIGPRFFHQYEFRRVGTGEQVARVSTQSRLQDIYTGLPVDISVEMKESFSPGGVPEPPESFRLPDVPSPPPGAFGMHRCINWQDLNARGQVDTAVLLGYLEECGMQVIAAHHWPVERLLQENMGILLRRNLIHYHQPARLHDELEIKTWAFDMRRVSATRHYRVTRLSDGALIAQVNSLGVWVNLTTGMPRRAPEHFQEDFAPNLA